MRYSKVLPYAALFLLTGLARAGKLAPDLEHRYHAPGETIDVIVQFKSGVRADNRRKVTDRGGLVKRQLRLVQGGAFRLPAEQMYLLADDPEVEFISPDRPVRGTAFTGTADYGWVTALSLTSSNASLPYDGTGIAVAVIDSGIKDSEDLQATAGGSRLVYKQSFVPGNGDPSDHYGHGSHVAGIIGGNGKKSVGDHSIYRVRGIAPNVNLVNLQALDSNGNGSDSSVIAAIQQAILLKARYNIRVINLSLGRQVFTSYASDPLCQAVQQAWNAGIVVVVSAGNDGRDNLAGTNGYATINAPGNSPFVITVGAMNTLGTLSRADDKITSYSSKGPTPIDHIVKPDLVAPGNRIISLQDDGTLIKLYPDNRVPKCVYIAGGDLSTPDYYQLSGTSMAAPMVSGAAALLLQENPTLTPDQVKAILMKTASKLPSGTSVSVDPTTGFQYVSQNDVFTVGAGYLDVQAALASKDLAAASALSPVAAFDPVSGTVHLVNNTSAVWGSSAVWGTSAVWGSSAVWGTGAMSAASAVWGTGSPFASSAVSGSSAVWGHATTSDAIAITGEQ
jgi:serine protease AprX